MLTRTELEMFIKKGWENNIMVYDIDAVYFSKRLLALMRTIAIRNNMGELKQLHLPYGAIDAWNLFHDFEDVKYGWTEKLYAGVELYTYDFSFSKYYDVFGSYPSNKKDIVVGVCEKTILLGAY